MTTTVVLTGGLTVLMNGRYKRVQTVGQCTTTDDSWAEVHFRKDVMPMNLLKLENGIFSGMLSSGYRPLK